MEKYFQEIFLQRMGTGLGGKWMLQGISKEVSFSAVQHERAPRSTSSLVGAVRRAPSAMYPGISHVYHSTGTPYHPLLYSGLFPFKPTVPTFSPGVRKSSPQLLLPPSFFSYMIFGLNQHCLLQPTFCIDQHRNHWPPPPPKRTR